MQINEPGLAAAWFAACTAFALACMLALIDADEASAAAAGEDWEPAGLELLLSPEELEASCDM